jgi:glycosyltransferase involved in cell wall biosynthesis
MIECPSMARSRSNSMSRPCHVMQVTWSLVAGGAEMYALTIASGLDDGKYRTWMCGVDEGGALEPEIRQRDIPFFIMRRREPGIDFKLMWRMYRLFREHRIDVVQTHHFNQLFYSLPGAILAGARVIHTEHSIKAYAARRLRIALRLLSLGCEKVIAIGEDGARVLLDEVKLPKRKLEIIRAGIDPARFREPRDESRRALGLAEEDRVAVIIARLYPEKNHRLLLAAFAEAAGRIERARLLIAGEGVEREAIEAEIHRLSLWDRVWMLGVRRDVPRLLAAADVFALSSDREGLPIAIIEAMAAARPVVATAVGDIPDVVRDGTDGRIVPPGDPAALAAALIELLGDRERAAEMGRNAQRFATDRFAVGAMIERYQQLFSSADTRP